MGGVYSVVAASNLTNLGKKLQQVVSDGKKSGLLIDDSIDVVPREEIEREMMRKKRKSKPFSIIFPKLTELFDNPSNQWFAFFHLHT